MKKKIVFLSFLLLSNFALHCPNENLEKLFEIFFKQENILEAMNRANKIKAEELSEISGAINEQFDEDAYNVILNFLFENAKLFFLKIYEDIDEVDIKEFLDYYESLSEEQKSEINEEFIENFKEAVIQDLNENLAT